MAGHALTGNFMPVDYKEVEHSNHVYRSFIYVIDQCGFHIRMAGAFLSSRLLLDIYIIRCTLFVEDESEVS